MILMLFHLFCMFDDYWRIDHRSLETPGKSTVKIHYLRRSKYKTKTVENITLPDHGGSHEERPRWGPGGPHPLLARPSLELREQVVWPPWPTSCRAPSRTSSPRKPKNFYGELELFRRRHEAENHREKKALRQAEICRGNPFPEGGNRRHRHRHRVARHRDHRHHHLHRRNRHLHRSTPFPL